MSDFTSLKKDKKNILIWGLVFLASLLLIIAVIYIFMTNLINFKSDKVISDKKINIENKIPVQFENLDLNKSFVGTRETIDGNIEPVLLEISEFDKSNLSFRFTLNIGMAKKYNGYGIIDTSKLKIIADVLGDLEIKYDSNRRLCLITNATNNFKYNLIEETK